MVKHAWNEWRSSHMGRLIGDSFYAQGSLYGVAIVAMIAVAATTAGSAYMMEYIVDAMTNPGMRGWAQLIALGVVWAVTHQSSRIIHSVFIFGTSRKPHRGPTTRSRLS